MMLELFCQVIVYKVYVQGRLAIDSSSSAHATNTIHGFKYAGTDVGFDNTILPNSTTTSKAHSHFYVSGHSLFTYTGGDTAPVSDYTTTGNWLGLLAEASGFNSSGAGHFGQITTLNNDWSVNPSRFDEAQITYPENTYPAWPTGQSMGDQIFEDHYFMASNFEQNSVSENTYATRAIELFGNVLPNMPNAVNRMYVHWPEPALAGSFVDDANLTRSEWTTYNDYTRGAYLTWHANWYDEIIALDNTLDIKMIPVGAIVADLVENESYMATVEYSDLNGDTSPHGTESMYFLASLVCYRAVHQINPEVEFFSFPVGSIVISQITDNLESIVTYIEQRLNFYNQTLEVY